MSIGSRIAAACANVIAASLALSGCAPQADWDGAKKLASEECVLAAQLFSAHDAPADAVHPVEAGEDAPEQPPTRTELADSLRPYVPEDLHGVLDVYALPEPIVLGDESEARQAEIAEVLSARSSAEDALRGWAQLDCGPEVGQQAAAADGDGAEWPALSQLQALEGEVDGVRTLAIAGAVEPDHAVALCEEARLHDAEARIEVTDLDGFPLALSLPGAACGYDPILLEGVDLE